MVLKIEITSNTKCGEHTPSPQTDQKEQEVQRSLTPKGTASSRPSMFRQSSEIKVKVSDSARVIVDVVMGVLVNKMKNDLEKAVTILKEGGLVAIPTETVYGLAANAENEDALKKIFAAKNRPIDHPLIVHIGEMSQLKNYVENFSDEAMLLAKSFWPGPLTLILKKSARVSKIITGGQDTIGIRMPNHSLTLELLKKFGGGVAAPSANKFGKISPTTAKAVADELGDEVDLILDGGQCEVGIESTIVDASSAEIKILRPGIISAKQIETILNHKLHEKNNHSPRVSGAMESHYAPRTPTFLLSRQEIEEKANVSCAAIFFGEKPTTFDPTIFVIEMPTNPESYAHHLYQVLREIDAKKLSAIFIEGVPRTIDWVAILDRLTKAAR